MRNPFSRFVPGRVPELADDAHDAHAGAETFVNPAAAAVSPSGHAVHGARPPEMTSDPHVVATSLDTVAPGAIHDSIFRAMRHQLVDIDEALLNTRRPGRQQLRLMATAIVQSMPPELQRELGFDNRRHRVIEDLANVMERFIATQPEHDAEATDQELARVSAQMIEVLLGDHVDTLVHGPLVAHPNGAERDDAVITSGHRSALVGKRITELVLWAFSCYTTFIGVSHYAGVGMEDLEAFLGYDFPNRIQEWLRYGIGLSVGVIISQTVIGIKHAVENIANTEGVDLIGGKGQKGAYRRYAGREFRDHKVKTLWLLMILLVDGLTNMSGVVTKVGRHRDMDKQIASLTGQIDAWKAKLAVETKDLDRRYAAPLEKTAQTDLDAEAEGEAVSKTRGHGPIWDAKNWFYHESSESRDKLKGRTGSHARDLYAAVERSPLMDGKPLSEDIRGRVAAAMDAVKHLLDQAQQMRGELDPGLAEEQLQERFDRIEEVLNGILPLLNEKLPAELRGQVDGYVDVQKAILDVVKRQYPNADLRRFEPLAVETINLEEIKLKIGKIEFRGVWDLIQSAFADQPQFIQGLLLAIAVAIGIGLSQGDQLFISGTRKAYNEDAMRVAMVRAGLLEPLMGNIARVIARLMTVGPYARFFKNCEVNSRVVLDEIKRRVEELADPSKTSDYPAVIGFLHDHRLHPGYWSTTTFAEAHNRRVEALMQIADDPGEMNLIIRRLLPGNTLLESANPNADVTGRVVAENTAHIAGLNNAKYREIIQEVVRYAGTLSGNGSADFSVDDFDHSLEELTILYGVLDGIRTFDYDAPAASEESGGADDDGGADGVNPHLEQSTLRALNHADTFLEEIESRIFDRRFAGIAQESLALARRNHLTAAELDRALQHTDKFSAECINLESDMTAASRAGFDGAMQSIDRARVDLFTLRFRTIQHSATNDNHVRGGMSADDMRDAHRRLEGLDSECVQLQTRMPAQCRDILGVTRSTIERQQNALDRCGLEQILVRCVAATETLRSDRAPLSDVDAIAAQCRVDRVFSFGLETSDAVTISLRTRTLAELELVGARVEAVRQAHSDREKGRIRPDQADRVMQVERDGRNSRLIERFASWSRDLDVVPDDVDCPPALIQRFISLSGLNGATIFTGDESRIPAETAQRIESGLAEFLTVAREQIDHPTLELDSGIDLPTVCANVEMILEYLRRDHFRPAPPPIPEIV